MWDRAASTNYIKGSAAWVADI